MNTSLEQEIRTYFEERGLPYQDHSRSFTHLDFGFGDRQAKRYFAFDAKEKQRPYNPHNWPTDIPEPHLFILDDLAARKVLLYAPNAGILVRDAPQERYVFFTVVDLFLMPKQRVDRPIRRNRPEHKGKWLVDLRSGQTFAHLPEVFGAIETYLDARKAIFHEIKACYGAYAGETISPGGIERRPGHWQHDVESTR